MYSKEAAKITQCDWDRIKANIGWLNTILAEHLLLVQRKRWLLLTEFCLGIFKGVTLAIGLTVIMQLAVVWTKQNMGVLSKAVSMILDTIR